MWECYIKIFVVNLIIYELLAKLKYIIVEILKMLKAFIKNSFLVDIFTYVYIIIFNLCIYIYICMVIFQTKKLRVINREIKVIFLFNFITNKQFHCYLYNEIDYLLCLI